MKATALPCPNANDPVKLAPGTRPEYTAVEDHYKVFIRSEPTVIDGANWVLPVIGMVDNPLALTLDQIRNNYESRDQFVTLSCISGRIATTLISTTWWTGVSLQNILADAQVQDGARHLVITSGDGFHETVDLDLIASDERIMLCYAWDGNPIPFDHGFPLRIWLPDRYGMKQPKWINRHGSYGRLPARLLGGCAIGMKWPKSKRLQSSTPLPWTTSWSATDRCSSPSAASPSPERAAYPRSRCKSTAALGKKPA